MTFPTIPTSGAGRILGQVQADTTATRTFPSLTGLTKNSGDLLIAIIVTYQSSVGARLSGWTGGFTEFGDLGTANDMGIGAAYKWSTGSETGTFAVTQAATITGHCALIVMAIPGAHASTVPEIGTLALGTTTAADPAALNPSGWDVEDTLWIAVGGCGETGTGGSFTGLASTAPTNYGDYFETSFVLDAAGVVDGAVAFRQSATASEDPGAFAPDLSVARNCATVIAVRPVVSPDATATLAVIATTVTLPQATPTRGLVETLTDDFADGTLNTALWSNVGGGTVTESGGVLHLNPSASGDPYAIVETVGRYNLASSSLYAELVMPSTVTASRQAFIEISPSSGNDLRFGLFGSNLGTIVREGGIDADSLFATYNATNHAWLRVRADASNLYADTSPDGSTWTLFDTLALPAWSVAAVTVRFACGWWNAADADPGELTVDNVNTLGGVDATATPAVIAATATLPQATATGGGPAPVAALSSTIRMG